MGRWDILSAPEACDVGRGGGLVYTSSIHGVGSGEKDPEQGNLNMDYDNWTITVQRILQLPWWGACVRNSDTRFGFWHIRLWLHLSHADTYLSTNLKPDSMSELDPVAILWSSVSPCIKQEWWQGLAQRLSVGRIECYMRRDLFHSELYPMACFGQCP